MLNPKGRIQTRPHQGTRRDRTNNGISIIQKCIELRAVGVAPKGLGRGPQFAVREALARRTDGLANLGQKMLGLIVVGGGAAGVD